ncbi:MAG: GIY-YIG nuclease family protein [Dehalococcoidia bacterium]
MDTRKTLTNEYKQAKVVGGVYRLVNTRNNMYLLDCTPNLQAKQNSFNFTRSSGSCLDFRLKEVWESFGGEAFAFEILESLEKKKEQSQEEFIDDLEMLKQLWSDKLDSSNRY